MRSRYPAAIATDVTGGFRLGITSARAELPRREWHHGGEPGTIAQMDVKIIRSAEREADNGAAVVAVDCTMSGPNWTAD